VGKSNLVEYYSRQGKTYTGKVSAGWTTGISQCSPHLYILTPSLEVYNSQAFITPTLLLSFLFILLPINSSSSLDKKKAVERQDVVTLVVADAFSRIEREFPSQGVKKVKLLRPMNIDASYPYISAFDGQPGFSAFTLVYHTLE
jgi:hypothetical protein